MHFCSACMLLIIVLELSYPGLCLVASHPACARTFLFSLSLPTIATGATAIARGGYGGDDAMLYAIIRHACSVLECLKNARQLGTVIIITNAESGWVEVRMKRSRRQQEAARTNETNKTNGQDGEYIDFV